jgi:hypothetical protein
VTDTPPRKITHAYPPKRKQQKMPAVPLEAVIVTARKPQAIEQQWYIQRLREETGG